MPSDPNPIEVNEKICTDSSRPMNMKHVLQNAEFIYQQLFACWQKMRFLFYLLKKNFPLLLIENLT